MINQIWILLCDPWFDYMIFAFLRKRSDVRQALLASADNIDFEIGHPPPERLGQADYLKHWLHKVGQTAGLGTPQVITVRASSGSTVIALQGDRTLIISLDNTQPITPVERAVEELPWDDGWDAEPGTIQHMVPPPSPDPLLSQSNPSWGKEPEIRFTVPWHDDEDKR